MVTGDDPALVLDSGDVERLRELLQEHGVNLAAVFGSTARGGDEPGDLDLVVEFDAIRPGDEGYSSAYLGLYSALDDELATDVDLVDLHSIPRRFAAVALEDAVVLIGDPDRLETVLGQHGDEASIVEEARDRITSAATRLNEGST